MKFKHKKTSKTLSDKIADALTLKPRADIEDDHVFGTKPHTVSRADFSSSDSEEETAISDFRKRNVNLLSDLSKKYEGRVVSREQLKKLTDKKSSDSEQDTDENEVLEDDSDVNGEESQSEDSDNSDVAKKFNQLTKKDVSESSDEESLSSPKKNLKVKSKQKTEPDAEKTSESEEESDDYSITQFKKQLDNESDQQSDNEDDSGGSDEGDDDNDEGYDISQMDEPPKEEFEHVKKQNISEEAKKGACVRNQLLVWEGLLEMRIHLQRCMNTANQMPMPDTYKVLKDNNDFMEECNATKANVTNVLDKLLTLQSLLLKNFPETKNFTSKQKPTEEAKQLKDASDEEIPSDTDNEEIPSDTEPEDNLEDDLKTVKKTKEPSQTLSKKRKLEDYEKDISTSHKAFKSFRDSTIQKWNDKTRLATATNVKNTPSNTVLQQISYILSDRDKLIRRTQLKRSEYDIVGYSQSSVENGEQNGTAVNPGTRDRKDNDEYIPEIFDDSDFYHQLLRELIECKSADISDPVQLSRQWIALQQMRSKMKRKVDTKATKGRKIKYVVHNQLVNYMAPEKCTTWNDESTNELYSSLFGKMFEQNNVGLNDNISNVFKIK